MKITLCEQAGFCFGVERAISMAAEVSKTGRVYTLGRLIHNEKELQRLREYGIIAIDNLSEFPEGQNNRLLIRSHGEGEEVYRQLDSSGIKYIDATCPRVSRIHDIVRKQSEMGRQVIIIGKKDHPEVIGIAGWCNSPIIFGSFEEMEAYTFDPDKGYSVVAQTTINQDYYDKFIRRLKKECTSIEIFDTICSVTNLRNRITEKLASECDAMIVVGDSNSSNTRRLVEVCSLVCPNVFFTEDANQMDWDRLFSLRPASVGVAAGTSTPMWVIREVVSKMTDMVNEEKLIGEIGTDVVENKENVSDPQEVLEQGVAEEVYGDTDDVTDDDNEQSFAEMLENSIKTLNTGEKVVGVITAINPNELHVDLGTKHAGYIPLEEISDDSSVKLDEVFKVGQEIEAYVLRVNDGEGTAMLSKKRLDMVKGWETLEEARANRSSVEGIVVEENKGGVVVSVQGVRVFVPASQTGVAKETPLSTLLKKRVKLKITEANRGRRRMVGSIRAAAQEERRMLSEKVWADIEVGKEYEGVVKSLTTYGVFVDIGGVDGMVHISELSWNRTKHPSEVMNVGDKVNVFVLSFDKEKKRISLGYRRPEDNPWNKFIADYNVSDTVTTKIVKLMPFGAFAEVIPGVDGLIHISQIADRHIAKPGDVLQEGQTVDVKITEIDTENKRISLSIRALSEPEVTEPAEDINEPDTVVAISDENATVAPDFTEEVETEQ